MSSQYLLPGICVLSRKVSSLGRETTVVNFKQRPLYLPQGTIVHEVIVVLAMVYHTVEPVLKDRPFGQKIRSLKTGGLWWLVHLH